MMRVACVDLYMLISDSKTNQSQLSLSKILTVAFLIHYCCSQVGGMRDAYTSIKSNKLTTVRIGIGQNLIRSNPDLPAAIPNASVIILHYNFPRMLSIVIEAFGQ